MFERLFPSCERFLGVESELGKFENVDTLLVGSPKCFDHLGFLVDVFTDQLASGFSIAAVNPESRFGSVPRS